MPERRGLEQPERWPERLPFRKQPKPYSRAITWWPANGSRPDRSRPFELFISQSVLRDVRSHLIKARTGEPYGFLLGHVVYCPWTEVPYIVVDALRRETRSVPHGADVDRFRRSWAAAVREARRRQGQVIGWYHRHGVLGLRLSEWDLRLQEEFFPEPWHCALLVAPLSGRVIGGFIQRSLRAHLFRKGLAPFYELVELGTKPIAGKRPSLVDWENYTTDDAVEVVRGRWSRSRSGSREAEERDDGGLRADDRSGRERRERERSIVVPRSRRRWRPTGSPSDLESGPDAGFVAEFARAAGIPEPDVPEAERPRPRRRTPDAPTPERSRREPDDGAAGGRRPRPARPAARQLTGDEIAAFSQAVWGPPRLQPDPAEDPVRATDLLRSSRLGPLPAGDAPEPVARSNGVDPGPRPGRGPSAEPAEAERSTGLAGLLPGQAPPAEEPPEADRPADLDWLRSLLDPPSLAATPSPPTAEGPAPSEARAPSDAEEPPAAEAKEPVAPEAGELATAEAEESAGEAERSRAPERMAPRRPAAGQRPSRPVLVGRAGADPEADTEAEIPIVMPTGEDAAFVRIVRRNGRRIAAGLLLLLVGGLAAFAITRRSVEQAPPAAHAQPVSNPAPSPTYRRLADAFEASLAAYRERSAEFGAGRIACAELRAGLEALEGAFRRLSARATLEPVAAASFPGHRDDLDSARAGFTETGCQAPAAPGAPTDAGDSTG